MAFNTPDLTKLDADLRAELQARLPELAPTRRSVSGVLMRVVAGAVHGLYGFLEHSHRQLFVDTADAEHLERHAAIWGLARHPATAANGTIEVTGTDGVVVPTGSTFQTQAGIRFLTEAERRISGGSAQLPLVAETPGAIDRIEVGSSLEAVSPLAGVDRTALATQAFGLGGELESDSSLRGRLLSRLRQPPQGGAKHDYEHWAQDRAAHGVAVSKVWIAPEEQGVGSVTIRFVTDSFVTDSFVTDSGAPSPADIASLQNYLETVRPITAEVFVVAPRFVPVNFVIAELVPDTQAVRSAIEAELRDLLERNATPGGTLLVSHIRQAVSLAAGEDNHRLVSPAQDLVAHTGELFSFGHLEVRA